MCILWKNKLLLSYTDTMWDKNIRMWGVILSDGPKYKREGSF